MYREHASYSSLSKQRNDAQRVLQWTPGGKGSFIALQKFVKERLMTFSTDRAKTDRSSTSLLSPHIHYGELSVRFIYYVVRTAQAISPSTATEA